MIRRPDYNARTLPPIEFIVDNLIQGKYRRKKNWLLNYLEQALIAELALRWNRADFFWERLIAYLPQKKINWPALAKLLNSDQTKWEVDLPAAKTLIINELLIDIYCGIYNRYSLPYWGITFRQAQFSDFLKKLLEAIVIPYDQKLSIIDPIIKSEIEGLQDQKKWVSAKRICEQILQKIPDYYYYQSKLANLIISEALSYSNETTEVYLKQLDLHIKELLIFKEKYPLNESTYKALGEAYAHHAINVFSLSPRVALLHLKTAKLYDVSLEQDEILSNLEHKIYHSGESEQVLQSIDVPNAEAIVADRITARDETWLVKFAVKHDGENSSNLSYQVLDALKHVIYNPPASINELPESWQKAKNLYLRGVKLNDERVFTYLQEKLSLNKKGNFKYSKQHPVIAVKVDKNVGNEIPFKYWLWSSKDKPLKIQFLIAGFLLVLALGLSGLEFRKEFLRNQYFQKVMADYQYHRHEQLMSNAASFFDNSSLFRVDARTAKVTNYYSEAFVKWYNSVLHRLDEEEVQASLEAFKRHAF